jgi:uncharacterized membrane protein YozB (DUF420 family)
MTIGDLPAVNATLNSISAVLLLIGYVMIRKRRTGAHAACMLSAVVTSTLFLTSYVIYHLHVLSKPYPGHGWLRGLYYAILASHVVLAIVIVPLVIITLTFALRRRFDRHRRIARITWPLWMYVSVTGVIVYLMLYQLPVS